MSPNEPDTTEGATLQLGEVLDFMRRIWAVDHALQKRSKKMGSTLGITGPQRLVLRIVGRYPGIRAGKLAEILHLHPSTLTGILQRLERQKLLKRQSDAGDARRALFTLTKQGAAYDRVEVGTVEGAVEKVLQTVTPLQRAATAKLLSLLARELEG